MRSNPRPVSLPFRKSQHPGVGFERIYLAHSCRIVVDEVDPGTYADLEYLPLSQGDDSRPNLSDGLRIAQRAYKTGVDMISVEGRGCLLPSCRMKDPEPRRL